MWTCVHNELHAEAGPAKKPEKYSILGALALVDDMVRATPAELVEELGHYFVDLGEPMGANLLIQAEYIAEGEYRG